MSKNYTNEHPRNKKNKKDQNTKIAETIKIDHMEFKLMKEAQEESKGDYKKYKDIFYKKYYKYKRGKNIKVIK